MSCVAVRSGDQFVASFLDHIDCQARTLGSVGYQSLADPGSPVSAVLTAILTLFIALFALRLLFGEHVPYRDALSGVVKIGILLLLATSWPAFRVLLYDVTIDGAQQVAMPIANASQLAPPDTGFAARLQNIDAGIARLTREGTGRFAAGTVAVAPGQTADAAFREIAMRDDIGMGSARVAYLVGAIAPLALLRMAAGILLALAPLFALLLLFDATRALFANWLSALFATLIGSVAMILMLGAELAILEPWLADALTRRAGMVALPESPTELLAMTLVFGLINAGMLYLVVRLAFGATQPMRLAFHAVQRSVAEAAMPSRRAAETVERPPLGDRRFVTTSGLQRDLEWGERGFGMRPSPTVGPSGDAQQQQIAMATGRGPSLGQVYRRTRHRLTASARGRDTRRD